MESSLIQVVTAASNSVMALAALGTLVFSGVVAWENRILRKAQTEPEVIAYLLPDPKNVNIVNFYVQNVASGVAMDVSFRVKGDIDAFKQKKLNVALLKERAPLTALPPGGVYKTFFGMGFNLLEEPTLEPFSVSLTYTDAKGTAHHRNHIFDVSQLEGVVATRDAEPEEVVAKAIKSLEDRIKKASDRIHPA